MSSLFVLTLLLTGYALYWILCGGLFYRIAAGLLCLMSVMPGVRRLVAANVGPGTDTFRLTLGELFTWTVSVNRHKGTLTGSIQLDAAKRLGWQRLIVASLAAALVPVVAGLLMPAALIAVGFGFLRSAPPPGRSSAGASGPAVTRNAENPQPSA